MMASITAAQNGANVLLLEKMDRPGNKILVSGGGRCNLTNKASLQILSKSFGTRSSFVKHALADFTSKDLMSFFEDNGLQTFSPDGFHIFPTSQKSRDVLQTLQDMCSKLSVKIKTGESVESIAFQDNAWIVKAKGDQSFRSKALILACGGKSYPGIGGGDSGYELAQSIGHSIIAPLPALSPVHVQSSLPQMCVGLSLSSVELVLKCENSIITRTRGDFLFTHTGISGPAVLDISTWVSRALSERKQCTLSLIPDPGKNDQIWTNLFVTWQQKEGSKSIGTLLSTFFPSRLAKALLFLCNLNEKTRAADFNKQQRQRITNLLSRGIPLPVISVEGFQKAMVTTGGVECSEVNPRTMQSRKNEKLFLCGEVLDVDGPCGGYNLQWAFSSGRLAGKNAAIMSSEKPESLNLG